MPPPSHISRSSTLTQAVHSRREWPREASEGHQGDVFQQITLVRDPHAFISRPAQNPVTDYFPVNTYKLWDLDLDTQAVSGLRPSPSRHFLSRFRVRSLQNPFLRLNFLHERFRRLRFCTKLVFRRIQLGRELGFEWWNGSFGSNIGCAECPGERKT